MKDTIPVYCKNIDTKVEVPCGITLQEFVDLFKVKYSPEMPFLGALVNNKERRSSFSTTTALTGATATCGRSSSCCSMRLTNCFPKR